MIAKQMDENQIRNINRVQFGPAEIDGPRSSWCSCGKGSESTTIRGLKAKANKLQVGGFQVSFLAPSADTSRKFETIHQALFLRHGRGWTISRIVEI